MVVVSKTAYAVAAKRVRAWSDRLLKSGLHVEHLKGKACMISTERTSPLLAFPMLSGGWALMFEPVTSMPFLHYCINKDNFKAADLGREETKFLQEWADEGSFDEIKVYVKVVLIPRLFGIGNVDVVRTFSGRRAPPITRASITAAVKELEGHGCGLRREAVPEWIQGLYGERLKYFEGEEV